MVSNVNFGQKGQKIEIIYNIAGAKFYQYFNVDIYVSIDGGLTFQGPLKEVSGDVGEGISAGGQKKISWNAFKEMPEFEGNVAFDVRALVMEKKITNHFFAGYKGTYTAPIGVITGLTGKTGFYVSARLNPGYFENVSYEIEDEEVPDYNETGYYTFSKADKIQRLSVTAGLNFQVGLNVHLYIGGGFAQYNLIWEIEQYDYPGTLKGTEWAKHTGESFTGLEAETGIIMELKSIFLSAGVAFPGFKWADISFSAGIVF